MSKENKKKTCPLNSNFAFAVIALLTAGLLLYTTVEVFNCKQDIAQINDRIQNSPKFVSAHDEQKIEKQGKDKSNENVDTKNVNENKEEIIYNKDGSIDTNNWKTYRNDSLGIEFKYPAEKFDVRYSANGSPESVSVAKKGDVDSNVKIYLSRGSYSEKEAFGNEKYAKFKKPIKIKFGKNLEGEMVSYELSDIGRTHTWRKLVSFEPLRYKTVSKKVSKKDYENSGYKSYLDFMEKKCDNVSFAMTIRKYPKDKYMRDRMIVNCHSNDTEDVKILLKMFNSLKVYEKTIKN